MIGLGNAVGGRHTPDRSPLPPETHQADTDEAEDAER